MTTTNKTRRRWPRRLLWTAIVAILLLFGAFLALGGTRIFKLFSEPATPFDPKTVLPAPDYARLDAWLAYPGEAGRERATPPGFKAIDEARAPADVFFIHPTTFSDKEQWNGPHDAPDDVAKLNPAVLLGQTSAFNGCCRLFAPRYRQATLPGLKDRRATALAYRDVARAFRHFIKFESKGRPFIIATHSQGTGHAVELLQREVLGTALKDRMVAAYLIGGYVPSDFAEIGQAICDAPRQTGCVISYNASKGWSPARMVIEGKAYWWQGRWRNQSDVPAVYVNPLSWRANGRAVAASANLGSLPFPKEPFPADATALPALTRGLTGASCKRQMLEVSLPWSAPAGFSDTLSRLLGSYHLNDYGLFYANMRANAVDRVAAWRAAHPSAR